MGDSTCLFTTQLATDLQLIGGGGVELTTTAYNIAVLSVVVCICS